MRTGETKRPIERKHVPLKLCILALTGSYIGEFFKSYFNSRFQSEGEAYQKEQSVICREDEVDVQERMTTDGEQVL